MRVRSSPAVLVEGDESLLDSGRFAGEHEAAANVSTPTHANTRQDRTRRDMAEIQERESA
jgi:hypothetical protein